MKVHYPKLYNMAHLLSLNVFTASKGSNKYILFVLHMLQKYVKQKVFFTVYRLLVPFQQFLKKVQLGNVQEMTQSERNPHSINRGLEKKLN